MGCNDCSEALGNKVDQTIASFFKNLGLKVANRPKTTIVVSLLFVAACGSGLGVLKTENRTEKLWVPQNTVADEETKRYKKAFTPSSRISNIILTASNDASDKNVLSKDALENAMKLHKKIEDKEVKDPEEETNSFSLVDICTSGYSCIPNATDIGDMCNCQVSSILGQWNFNITTLQNDDNYLATLNSYGDSKKDLVSKLGKAAFDDNGDVASAESFSIIYFVKNNGMEKDPTKEAWEKEAFLSALQSDDAKTDYPGLSFSYITERSFSDEFGTAIQGDLVFVQISYIIAFIFLGATLGRLCGSGSRWAVSLCALLLVAASTLGGIGLSSYLGLFYGPVHSLLPFVLLGIGVDDVFVIVNAFNRERTSPREKEDDDQLRQRSSDACARSGASITVTSLTDMVAFAISSSSALPALASFCAYAAVGVLLLWILAATFFVAVVVQDEKRQRDNKWDLLCCFKRKADASAGKGFEENYLSSYFRKYHAPAILNKLWNKVGVLLIFVGLFAFGIYGALNLAVEDSQRSFIPEGSYINDFFSAGDNYIDSGSTAIGVSIVFTNGQEIYEKRSNLAQLKDRVRGKSDEPPYISEPDSESSYVNVMTGLANYLGTNGTDVSVQLGNDTWPENYEDFITVLKDYLKPEYARGRYAASVGFADNSTDTDITIRVSLQYIKLTKESRGKTIDDADRQIEAMDATREMVKEWNKEGSLPPAFPFSDKFINIEGFKIIKLELFRNAGLAIMSVGIITFMTLGNIVTALLITISVIFCIVEILGFMYAAGLVIDSVSVINIVLAVGLSVDYSAHVGHSFMVKSGKRNDRVTEALADIGASVLNGALSTFLAVAVLLGSSSYVFKTLAIQFALTVGLGVAHGLVFLPVLLSLFGPNPFSSAIDVDGQDANANAHDGIETNP